MEKKSTVKISHSDLVGYDDDNDNDHNIGMRCEGIKIKSKKSNSFLRLKTNKFHESSATKMQPVLYLNLQFT